MSTATDLVKSVVAIAYPAVEPFVDTELTQAGEAAADFVADQVENTATKWDNEGAEKLEITLFAAANRLKARREAFAAGQTNTGDQPA